MYDHICRMLLNEGARSIYTATKVLGSTLKALEGEFPFMHSEVSLDEKIAFELALTGSWTSKRTACIFSTEGIYNALDPVMSAAYTGVAGGFLIICMKEIEEDSTPVGLFSKLPFMVAEGADALSSAIRFGYTVSEKYEIPVVIQATPEPGEDVHNPQFTVHGPETARLEAVSRKSEFIKNPARWAATPKYRYDLHIQLNEKIAKIREEFEGYEGNVSVKKGKTGVITSTRSSAQFFDDDVSMLILSTIFPMPVRRVDAFVAEMDEVFIAEGPYPVLEMQISDRSKIFRGPVFTSAKRTKPEEAMYGFTVVRDTLGPASSINMAHGIKKNSPEKRILAITFEDYFFQAGMPALVNTMYNASSYVLLVIASSRMEEVKRIMEAYGCKNFANIEEVSEIEHFNDQQELTVLFYKGII